MAGKAEEIWRKLIREQEFGRRIERLTIAFIPDFGLAATTLLSQLLRDRAILAVGLWDGTGEKFTMMV